MGMFDQEVPQELTPLQEIQMAAGRLAERTAPFLKESIGYESPEREMRRVASETDLSNSDAVQKTFNFLMSKNPQAAASWLKSVKPVIDQHIAAQSRKTTSVDPVKQAKQVRRNFLIAEYGVEEGNRMFLQEEQKKKIAAAQAGVGDTAYSKAAGPKAVEQDMNLVDSAKAAVRGLNKTQKVLDILDTGEVNTGILADVQQLANRLTAKFGGSKEALEKATNTEVLEALLGSDVFPMIKSLGIGARGLDTPAEREFLLKVMTGDKSNQLDTIRRLTEIRQQINKDTIDEYNKRFDSGQLERYQNEFNVTLSRIVPNKPRPSDAKRIVNKTTGQVLYEYPDGNFYTPDGKLYQ